MTDQPQRPYESTPSGEAHAQAPDAAGPASGAAPASAAATAAADENRVVVLTPEGMGVARMDGQAERGAEGREAPERERSNPADLVEEPAKVMRIGSMVKQLLEEVRNAPLDDQGRRRLVEIHHRSIEELKDGLAPELVEELDRITLPFSEDHPATDAELRIAQAQLVGWLEGLFHGIQTAIMAQQMAAQAAAQHQQVRGEIGAAGQRPGASPGGPAVPDGPTGQYL